MKRLFSFRMKEWVVRIVLQKQQRGTLYTTGKMFSWESVQRLITQLLNNCLFWFMFTSSASSIYDSILTWHFSLISIWRNPTNNCSKGLQSFFAQIEVKMWSPCTLCSSIFWILFYHSTLLACLARTVFFNFILRWYMPNFKILLPEILILFCLQK